jgi:hypothetical protein
MVEMIKNKRIIWKKNKNVNIINLLNILKNCKKLSLVNFPVDYIDDVIGYYNNYKVKIYNDKNDEIPLNKELYELNYNYIHQNKIIHYIDIDNENKEIEIYLR